MGPARNYRGRSPEERKEARRLSILQAAISVFGDVGYRAATVQAICDAAGLTKRYFYESYKDSNDLLEECFRVSVGELIEELSAYAAEQGAVDPRSRTRAILTRYFESLRDDPGQSRLFLLDAEGVSPGVTSAMHDAERAMADLLVPAELFAPDDARSALFRLGAMSGIARVSSLWIAGNCALPIQDVVESGLSLFDSVLPRHPLA